MDKDNIVVRYSDKDLAKFKKIIEEKISKAQHDLELIKSAYMNDGNNGTEDTSLPLKHLKKVHKLCQKKQIHN